MRFDVRISDDAGTRVPDAVIVGRCGCGARWPGLRTCHCAVCHVSFTSSASFDQHHSGSIHPYDPEKDTRRCRTESELRAAGMEPNDHGLWRKPRPEDTLPGRDTDG